MIVNNVPLYVTLQNNSIPASYDCLYSSLNVCGPYPAANPAFHRAVTEIDVSRNTSNSFGSYGFPEMHKIFVLITNL